MTHTVDTLMALHNAAMSAAVQYADCARVSLRSERTMQAADDRDEANDALRTALTEALAQPVQAPLTDEQIQEIYISEYNKGHHGRDFENAFARAIERAHHIGGDK